jgi:hypothetical protein
LVVGFGLDGVGTSSSSVRPDRNRAPEGAMVGGLGKLKLELRCMKQRKVSSYAI